MSLSQTTNPIIKLSRSKIYENLKRDKQYDTIFSLITMGYFDNVLDEKQKEEVLYELVRNAINFNNLALFYQVMNKLVTFDNAQEMGDVFVDAIKIYFDSLERLDVKYYKGVVEKALKSGVKLSVANLVDAKPPRSSLSPLIADYAYSILRRNGNVNNYYLPGKAGEYLYKFRGESVDNKTTKSLKSAKSTNSNHYSSDYYDNYGYNYNHDDDNDDYDHILDGSDFDDGDNKDDENNQDIYYYD